MSDEKVFMIDGIFVKESELTKEQLKPFVQKLVKTFNDSPLLARDYFSRGVLASMGVTEEVLAKLGIQIELKPPENDDSPSDGELPSKLIIT
jgi:hypothetical protein